MKEKSKENSRSVVYSFDGRWEKALASGKVKVFFRKRRPVLTPSKVFIYVGVPVKKIIGFASVKNIEPVDLEAAMKIKQSGAITENELISYVGTDRTVSAIWIERPTLFSEPFSLSDLSESHGFNPPQSFCKLSIEFENYLLGVTT